MTKAKTATLPPTDRLQRARGMTSVLVDHVIELLAMHEANAVVLYSDALSAQIPRSYAANAFRRFQTSMAGFEVIRICACWQVPDLNDACIPNILSLVQDAAVRAAITADVEAGSQLAIRTTMAKHVDDAVRRAVAVQADPRFKALLNHRNRYLAFNLQRTRLEERTTVDRMKHGDEAWLLEETRLVANHLHHGLNRAAFDWEGARNMSRRNAHYFWCGCHFTNLR